jgi:hypothetical protein
VKDWEIIADNKSGLLMHIATTGGASLCGRMKSSARFWNWKLQLALLPPE